MLMVGKCLQLSSIKTLFDFNIINLLLKPSASGQKRAVVFSTHTSLLGLTNWGNVKFIATSYIKDFIVTHFITIIDGWLVG